MNKTEYLQLNKPERVDPADITQLDGNWDSLDSHALKTDEHLADYNNPHKVTKEQLGIDLSGFEEHIADKNNPHGVTMEQLGIDLSDFEEHIANKQNPHEVTAAQVNAVSKNGDTVNGDLTIKGAFTVEDNPIKATNGVTTLEIQGLNNPTADGHHFMDYALSGTNGSVHLRVNLENANGMHSPRELMQILTLSNSGDEHWYQIFNEGNKPSGTYNGTNATRTIDTGGIGNVLMVWGSSYVSIITANGGFTIGNDNTINDGAYDTSEVKFVNGVLTIGKVFPTTENHQRDGINGSGITYHYQVL